MAPVLHLSLNISPPGVCLGCLLFHEPWGFHFKACLQLLSIVILWWCFLKAWPIHFHFFLTDLYLNGYLTWTDLHILRLEYKFILSDQRICLEFNVILQLMYLFLSFCLKMCHCCEDIFFKLWVKGLNDFSCFSFKVVEILKLRYFFEMFLFYFISL